MDIKVILAVVLSVLTLIVFQYFSTKDVTPRTMDAAKQETRTLSKSKEVPKPPAVAEKTLQMQPAGLSSARDVIISTELYQATFTEFGGRLKSFKLKNYKESILPGSPLKELVKTEQPQEFPLEMSFGSNAANGIESSLFKADRYRIQLSSKDKEGSVSFTYDSPEGLRFVKRYTFYPRLYRIDLDGAVSNSTPQALKADIALSLLNRPYDKTDGYTFSGPAVYVDGKLHEIDLKDLKEPQEFSGKVSWIAYEDRYFITALAPRAADPGDVRISRIGQQMTRASYVKPSFVVPAGGQNSFGYQLYIGPKDLSCIKQLEGLDKSIDFGWVNIIAKPFLLVLKIFNRFTYNYGLAIIVLTVLIKIVLWWPSQKSYQSMKQMQKLQPKLAKIREKYKDDKQKMNEEIMSLYKTYKINPLGGCLPMVLQIPVFFALYKVLLNAIELRHAPLMLWINDLSAPDRLPIGIDIPYLGGLPILTLLMGGSMFLQQWMTPTTGDPTQAKIMLLLPVIFTFMFVNFPAGLVLYWFVSNVLSIGQQYFVNKKAA
ncbi:MAG: membrane protein insertase YidC [Pseudomonadota bacterium]